MTDSISKFESSLTRDFKRRTQRLIDYEGILEESELSNETFQKIILRGATIELCSQWEGFCKNSIRRYMDFINCEIENLADVRVELRAAEVLQIIAGKMSNVGNKQTRKFRHYYDEVFILLHDPRRYSKKVTKEKGKEKLSTDFLSKQSTIDWEYFEELMWAVGVSIDKEVELYGKSLDELIKDRNGIAHGEDRPIDFEIWKERSSMIRHMMKYVSDKIRLSAAEGMFLASNQRR